MPVNSNRLASVFALSLLVSGCAVTTVRTPQSELTSAKPKSTKGSLASLDPVTDPLYMQTKADFHFAHGEALSLEGEYIAAVDQFKTALTYDQKAPNLRLRLAKEYVRVGLVSEALKEVQSVVKIDPKNTEALVLEAGLYSSLRLYDEALADYRKVLEIDPGHLESQVYVGAIMVEQKKNIEAIQYFAKLAENPKNKKPYMAWYYMARVYQEMNDKGSLGQAEKALEKAMQVKPDFVDGTLALGSLYESQSQQPKALARYKKFQENFGPNADVAEQLGRIYVEKKQYNDALAQFEIVEAVEPQNLHIKLKVAFTMIEVKQYEGAIRRLEEIVEKTPEADKIRFYLGAIYEEIKNYPAAIQQFSHIEKESSYYPDAIIHTAFLQKNIGQFDKGLMTLEGGLRTVKDNAQMYALYISFLEEKKDYDKALMVVEQAQEKFPTSAQLQFFAGSLWEKKGNSEKAMASLKQVIALDPNHVQGLNFLAYLYAQNDTQLEEAEKLVRRALKHKPDDGFILDTLGWVLFKRGQVSESLHALEKAFKIESGEGIIAEHLGDVYAHRQLSDKALAMYLKAAEVERDAKNLEKLKQKIGEIQSQVAVKSRPGRVPAATQTRNP